MLDIPLIRGKGFVTPNSPVLDKIIPELGYIKDNIHVISNKANLIKSNATPREIKLVADYMEKHHPLLVLEVQALSEIGGLE